MKRERDRMRSQMEREQEREVQKVRIAALFTSLFLNRFFSVSLPNRLVNTGWRGLDKDYWDICWGSGSFTGGRSDFLSIVEDLQSSLFFCTDSENPEPRESDIQTSCEAPTQWTDIQDGKVLTRASKR
jgi:hypothetical protein